MKTQILPKITILGCGFSGMITALTLAHYNIPVTIIEKRSCSNQDFTDIRSTALTHATKTFFQEIGIWEEIEKISGVFNDIYVIDNKSPEMLHLSSSELKNSEVMGYLVQNTEFKELLFKLVSKKKLIKIIDKTSYLITKNTTEFCELLLNNTIKHTADLLIVCDGRKSEAKYKYFSSALDKSYNQHAITFIVSHEKKHEGTAVEHFMSGGPFAILPMKNENLSSVVWTINSNKNDAILNLPQDELHYILQKQFGEFLGKVKIQSELASFPLKAYMTKKYYNKSIALIADTAHIMHPLAGQGLNQGIKDIACLVELLQKHGTGEHMLNKYETTRKIDNDNMLELTDMINSVFLNNSRCLFNIRQLGFKFIENTKLLKTALIKYAMGKR